MYQNHKSVTVSARKPERITYMIVSRLFAFLLEFFIGADEAFLCESV
jgi:hypothetical protein